MISGNLNQGVTNERVLQDIRDSGDTSNFMRIHYTEKKDLHNNRLNFKIGMTRFHSDDTISVDILINELCKQEDPSVIYYVNNDQEFALIIKNLKNMCRWYPWYEFSQKCNCLHY